jgi:hypothetical protein
MLDVGCFVAIVRCVGDEKLYELVVAVEKRFDLLFEFVFVKKIAERVEANVIG